MGEIRDFSDNRMISYRQTAWILALDILAAGLFWLPVYLAGKSFVDMLAEGAVALILIILYYGASFRWLNTRGEIRNGRWIQVLFIFYYLAALIFAVQYFYDLVDALIPENYTYPVPILFLLAALIYGGYKTIEVRGRLAELVGWLVIISFLFLLGVGCWQAIGYRWPQEGGFNWREVLPVGYGSLWFFLLGDHPLLLWRHMRDSEKNGRLLWLGLCGGCLMVLAALTLTGIFITPEGMAAEAQPFGILLQLIRFPGNFISRYDVFFIMLWMLSFYLFSCGMMQNIVEMVCGLFQIENVKGKSQGLNDQKGQKPQENLKDLKEIKMRRLAAVLVGILALALAALTRQWAAYSEVFQEAMLWIGVPVCVFLVIVGYKKSEKVEK